MLPALKPLHTPTLQASKLLPALFQHIDVDNPVTVFHVGPAVPETVDFRCLDADIQRSSPVPIPASTALRYDGPPAEQPVRKTRTLLEGFESQGKTSCVVSLALST